MTTKIKLTIAVTFCLFGSLLNAQRNVNWVGGTPGNETDWFCHKNWSNAKVPDEFTNVYIANTSSSTFQYPVIKGKEAEALSVYIVPEANLTIEKSGSLYVVNSLSQPNTKSLINRGNLILFDQIADNEIMVEQY